MRTIKALLFSEAAHAGQIRKYTGEPYAEHPQEVMAILEDIGITDTDMLCAALLHDVVEDTDFTHDDIEREFGGDVGYLVWWVTDISKPEDGNRAARKKIDRDHLAGASAAAQTIKLADLISNTKSIKEHDPKFWKVYREEALLLLDVLVRGDSLLRDRLKEQLKEGE